MDATFCFYVTVKDGRRTGWLLGPYDIHETALGMVEEGRRLATERDPWAHFYTFGTAGSTEQIRTLFGDR